MKKFAFILFLLLLSMDGGAWADVRSGNPLKSRPESRSAAAKGIEKFMAELNRRGQFNGAVLVADRQGVVYRGGFGIANRASNSTFTPDTPSCLASLSKPLTALAVMMLAEQGSIKYDNHISEYIPELPPALGVVTVRQLLTHTSGIPDYSDLNVEHPGMTNAEVLRALTRVDHTEFQPGEKYRYSNSGYVLLGILVERVSGTPLSDFLQNKIFGPLRMLRSFVLTNDQQRGEDVARAYSGFGTPDDYQAFVTGDGGVYSTVDDLYLLDRSLYTDTLVRQSALAEAFTPASVRQGNTTYGFGWNVKEEDFGKRVWHTGSTAGFRAFIERRLADHSVVIMLTNVGNSKRVEINEAIHAILEGRSVPFPQKSSAVALYEVIHTSGVDEAIKNYRDYKVKSSDEYDLSESELNLLGYQLLYGDKNAQSAIQIFVLNTQEHPSSSNAFDSLAEAYQVAGKKSLAKANYVKAIELDPSNVHAKTMLAQVGSSQYATAGILLGGVILILLLYSVRRRMSNKKA
jgi:CubicO group peptidase (beta-lactamase class C family)